MGRRWLAGRAVRARRAQERSVLLASLAQPADPVLRFPVDAGYVPVPPAVSAGSGRDEPPGSQTQPA